MAASKDLEFLVLSDEVLHRFKRIRRREPLCGVFKVPGPVFEFVGLLRREQGRKNRTGHDGRAKLEKCSFVHWGHVCVSSITSLAQVWRTLPRFRMPHSQWPEAA